MMSGDSYFITTRFLSDAEDVKIKFGFNYSFLNMKLPLGFFPFVSYKQKSFWNIYQKFAPFCETNYNPAVGLVKLFVDKMGGGDSMLWA